MNVFVIGNGFDLAHGLKTGYSDFKKYLLEEYQEDIESFDGDFPEINDGPDGGIYVPLEVAASLLYYLINDAANQKWSDVENSLEYFNFIDRFDHIFLPLDKEGDIHYSRYEGLLEVASYGLTELMLKLTDLLNNWIYTIDMNQYYHKRIKQLYNCENKNDMKYISFNYTDTLEKLYGIARDNILYLHGKCGTNDRLIFGHGATRKDDYELELEVPFGDVDFYLGSKFDHAIETLKKDTTQPLKNLHAFLGEKKINKIYFYGFSFSEVDLVYVKKLLKLMNKDSTVYLNDYFEPEYMYCKIKNIIRGSGFEGSIEIIKFSMFLPNRLFEL